MVIAVVITTMPASASVYPVAAVNITTAQSGTPSVRILVMLPSLSLARGSVASSKGSVAKHPLIGDVRISTKSANVQRHPKEIRMRMLARRRPRYAEVTATLALIVALGGTSYAVTALPRNSVGAKQLKPDAVTSSKVRDGSLAAKDFAKGQLPIGVIGATGATGATGPKGDPGAKGDVGTPGSAPPVFTGFNPHGTFPLGFLAPQNTVIVQLNAGSYVIQGNIIFHNPNADIRKMTCTLVANAPGTTAEIDTEEVDVPPHGEASISATGTLQANGPVGIFQNCGPDPTAPPAASAITFDDADVVVIAVGHID